MSQLQTSNRILFSLFAVGVVLLSGFIATPAEALTISPARIELTGDAGTTITGEFLLVNEEAAGRTFYSSAENFQAQGETGTPSFTRSDEGLASWISVEPQVALAKGEEHVVPFTITIPEGADPGGHFAAIFLSTVPPSPDGSQVAIGAKIGVLILLRVSGDITEAGGVSDFGLKGGPIGISLPTTLTYRFSNDGGDRVNPHGEVTLRSIIGLVAARLDANAGEGNVLPDSVRRFDVTWGDGTAAPSGFFSSAWYEFTHFALGPYFANLDLAYGSTGQTAHASTMIFMFPWQLLIILAVILVIIIFGIRSYNRWIIKKASKGQM